MADSSLNGRIAIVTGAAGDIGAAIVQRFVAAGCKVAALDRDLDALHARYPETGGADAHAGVLSMACDVADARATEAAVAEVIARWGALHIVVNNAATVTPTATIADLSLDDWDTTLAVNLTGAWLMAKWAIPHMTQAGGGVVLNIASQLGHVTSRGRGAYGVSKAGLLALTRSIAVDHAMDGIRAVSLSPGAVMTRRVATRYGGTQEANDALAGRYPVQRLGTVDDVADAALFMVGDGAAFITGTDLLVDGGYTAV